LCAPELKIEVALSDIMTADGGFQINQSIDIRLLQRIFP